MMATMLGKEKFRKAMDLYFETFDGQAVTTSDFVWAMSTGGERDLTQFEDSWYHQPRTPHITVTESYDSETQEYTLTVVQNSQKDQEGNTLKPWYFPLGIALFDRESHEQYPLDIADTKQDLIDRDMLIISRMQEVFVFRGITSKPVLSINRGFTSPVRVTMEEQDTLFLMQHETNPIARYQAAQESAREAIKSLL